MFTRAYSLFINSAAGPTGGLLASLLNSQPAQPVIWVVQDDFTVNVYLAATTGTVGAAYIGQQIAGSDELVLGIKPQSSPGASTFLASASAFTQVFDGTNYYYQATLNLNTTALITAVAAAGEDGLPVVVTIQEQNAANTSRFSFEFNATIIPTGVLGTEGAVPSGNPPYASPQNTITIVQGITALTGGAGTDLDGQPTAGGVAPRLLVISVPGSPRMWELIASPAITSASVASNSVITTAAPHGLANGQSVIIGGVTGSTPNVNGTHTATVIDSTHFSIAVDVTVAGTGGFATPAANPSGGIVLPADFNSATNATFWRSLF